MKKRAILKVRLFFASTTLFLSASLSAGQTRLPKEMIEVMTQPKYAHSTWGVYLKNLHTGEVLYDVNAEKLLSPASTTKLFSVAALLNAFGDNFRFHTPVYAAGKFDNGTLEGNLILVGQGDLTLGGRQPDSDTIAFTKLDHIIANEVPGVILTPQDPLCGLKSLARQVYESGVRELYGNVIVNDSLFETTVKRGYTLSPVLINENLIDIILNPRSPGQSASLSWRPQAPCYSVENKVITVRQGDPLAIEVTADPAGRRILVEGTIPMDAYDIVRTFPIKDPQDFVRRAFIEALKEQGIKMIIAPEYARTPPPLRKLQKSSPIAVWTSPPLSEYAKLILKVSHNVGADLIPLLLAAKNGLNTFDEGMRIMGAFTSDVVGISPTEFVFADAAGGNNNRLTPQAETQLLRFVRGQGASSFQHFFDALPILGVDGSLEDFARCSPGVGKVRAKPGTGITYNLATGKFFLETQALAGYIEGKNGHLFAYMVVVNNGSMPTIEGIFPIFEDISQLSSMLYEHTSSPIECSTSSCCPSVPVESSPIGACEK